MSDIRDFIPKESMTKFFQEQRERITSFLINRYNAPEEDAEEAFCLGCHALLEAIHEGRFTSEHHEYSLVKYLQTCCKNQLMKMFEQQHKEIAISKFEDEDEADGEKWPDLTDDDQDGYSESRQQKDADIELMLSIIEDLPHPCKDLIWGKQEGFSSTEMAVRLGYSNNRVAVTTLSRCMKKLKERFNKERRIVNEE